MKKRLIIAVDGYSGCGKTTLAKDLAKKISYLFIDTGAMYRGVTLFALQNGMIENGQINAKKLIDSLPFIRLSFHKKTEHSDAHLYLNGDDVEEAIRMPEIAALVAQIAQIREVRHKLIAQQQEIGRQGAVVLDGRDIASAVFPNADLKLFITADIEVRTQRRWQELTNKGVQISPQEVCQNLIERDELDKNRAENPLIQVADAILIDTSTHTRQSQLDYVLNLLPN